MIVGSYVLHLYCDSSDDLHAINHRGDLYDWDQYIKFPIEYSTDGADSYHSARRRAKKDGWILKRDGTALCPKCAASLNIR